MTKEQLVKHCSPTLAGIKTGNIFNCCYESEIKLRDDIRSMNRLLVSRGVRMLPLRINHHKALIYVFRPLKLKEDLKSSAAEELLKNKGYGCCESEKCVVNLIRRLDESEDFPHEIGLFLGYPPEDVKGFIEKGAKECKICGCWKVYGDEEKAKQLFRQYKECTREYLRLINNGVTLEKLIA